MKNIPSNIIRKRRDSQIVLKEKKSKITLLNPDKKLYHEVKVDGDLYAFTETNEKKCDYLEIGEETSDAFFIELKGVDIDTAYEQLLASAQNINVGNVTKKIAIVVSPHIPRENVKLQKYLKLCKKQGIILLRKKSGEKYPLY